MYAKHALLLGWLRWLPCKTKLPWTISNLYITHILSKSKPHFKPYFSWKSRPPNSTQRSLHFVVLWTFWFLALTFGLFPQFSSISNFECFPDVVAKATICNAEARANCNSTSILSLPWSLLANYCVCGEVEGHQQHQVDGHAKPYQQHEVEWHASCHTPCPTNITRWGVISNPYSSITIGRAWQGVSPESRRSPPSPPPSKF